MRLKGPKMIVIQSHDESRRSATRVLLAAAAVLVLLAGGCSSGDNASSGSPATPVAEFLKARGLQGRIALIQFGMVGCELSEDGLGKMVALDKDHRIAGLSLLRVEGSRRSKQTDDYFAAKAPGFAVYYDGGGEVGAMFDATVWPTCILVDKFGRIRGRGPWPDETKLAQWVATLSQETADTGPEAPLFDADTLDGPKLLDETCLPALGAAVGSLRTYMGSKGLLVVFVDTKCPYAALAMSELPGVATVFAGQGVPCVLVNIGESRETVEKFFAAKKMAMPVLYDTSKAAQKAWAIAYVPTVVLMDSSGAIAYRGKAVWADLGAAGEKGLHLPAGSLKLAAKGTEFG
jgi:hypothetical protein